LVPFLSRARLGLRPEQYSCLKALFSVQAVSLPGKAARLAEEEQGEGVSLVDNGPKAKELKGEAVSVGAEVLEREAAPTASLDDVTKAKIETENG
jgi:hypothetical protein